MVQVSMTLTASSTTEEAVFSYSLAKQRLRIFVAVGWYRL